MRFKNRFFVFVVGLAAALFLAATTYSPAAYAKKLPAIKSGDPIPADLFIKLAKMINPTVVNISTSQRMQMQRRRPPGHDPFFDMFEQFLGPQMQLRPAQSLGTGFIIRADGLIVTNAHVVKNADVIKVRLSGMDENDEGYDAKVIGQDTRTDIALIKIKPKKKLPVAELGTSDGLEVGEWVAAFGNPFGHSNSMTKGIVSAKGREIDELNRFAFIQTDASINPGNSGGPLVNTRGEVIGVNTAIDARAQGIGFAIPIDNVKSIIDTLEKDGVVTRGFIGVYLKDIGPKLQKMLQLKNAKGALITDVMEDGPADKAGIKPYDVITKFGTKKVDDIRDLSRAVADTGAGKKAKVQLLREGKKKTVKIKVTKHPDDASAPTTARTKSYRGQKAPHNLGFKVADYSKKLAKEMGIENLRRQHPIIIDVETDSPSREAGLYPGDVILDINRRPVYKAKGVLRRLRKPGENMLRILRGRSVFILYL